LQITVALSSVLSSTASSLSRNISPQIVPIGNGGVVKIPVYRRTRAPRIQDLIRDKSVQTGNRDSSSDISRPYPDKNLSITQKLGVVRIISLQCRQRYSREKSRIILRSASKYARLPLSGAASIQCLEEVASSKCTPTMTVVNKITVCVHVCQKDCVGQ
jgi:hypothetical protein